jgi:hypothetical protein
MAADGALARADADRSDRDEAAPYLVGFLILG